ncbi:MAG: hypothetical protein IJE53_06370 [Bacilli bacterium]|nr:hypothetical protein [Bacilli bacterium]
MRKKVIIISTIILLLIMLYFVIQMFDPFHTLPIVELTDNLTAEQNEKVTNISYIEDVRHGKVISKEENIDTTTLGKKKIKIEIENNYGKKREYIFYIDVKEVEE